MSAHLLHGDAVSEYTHVRQHYTTLRLYAGSHSITIFRFYANDFDVRSKRFKLVNGK